MYYVGLSLIILGASTIVRSAWSPWGVTTESYKEEDASKMCLQLVSIPWLRQHCASKPWVKKEQ